MSFENIDVTIDVKTLILQLLSTFLGLALLIVLGYFLYTVIFKMPKKMSKIETELQSLNESVRRIDKLNNSDK